MVHKAVGADSSGQARVSERYPAQPQDLLNYFGRSVANQQVNIVLRLDGSLDEERLRRAFRLTFDAQPILGCRFVDGPDRPYWERRDDLDDIEPCAVVTCGDTDAGLWRFVATPTDPRRDPLVRAVVARNGTDTLCIKMDHVAADAAAARQYLKLLAGDLRHPGE